MLYRPFGKTGKSVSTVSFGGMRFSTPDDLDGSAELLLYAHQQGINYFDTAPLYCGRQSEIIFGHALQQLPRDSFIVASKSSRSNADELRRELEQSLEKLQLERLDFFYIWCLMTPQDWQQRQSGGAVEAALKAKEEGLISHLLCSSHMPGDGLSQVLAEDIFEGVLLGYNALNFPYRQQAVALAGEQQIGVATMNPLAGGLIPQNPERFSFLKQHPDDDVVSAAIRFNLSNPAISTALVGFAEKTEIDQAVAAVNAFDPAQPIAADSFRSNIQSGFDALCTGCGYCLPCPVDIPIPQYLDTCNQVMLQSGDASKVATERLRYHWGLTLDKAADCIACGACETRCTQHLPIIERLQQLAAYKTA